MSSTLSQRFQGKIAIVTASTEGIGYATARRLAQEGATVIISSRKQANVDKAVGQLKSENLNVIGLVCHVGNKDDRKRLLDEAEKLGGLDILVSNAGACPTSSLILNTDEAVWDKIFDINVKSSWLLAKEALPLLRKRPSGRIVFVSSITAYQPSGLIAAYAVSKTALLGLTKAVAQQLVSENITVNCVAPGAIKTKFSSVFTGSAEAEREVIQGIPMKRIGVPVDVSGVIAFLVSDDASYITGESIVIGGGKPSRL